MALCKAREYIAALTNQVVNLAKAAWNAGVRLNTFIKNANKDAGKQIIDALAESEAAKLITSKMQEYIDNSIRNLTSTAMAKLEGYTNPYMMILTELLKYPDLILAFLAILIIPLVKALEKEKKYMNDLLTQVYKLLEILNFFEKEGKYSEKIIEDILAAIKLLNLTKLNIEKSYESIEVCNVSQIKFNLNIANINLCGAIGILSSSNSTFGVDTKAALDVAESPSKELGITGTKQERRTARGQLMFERAVKDPLKQEFNKYKNKGLEIAEAAKNIQSIMQDATLNHLLIESSLDTIVQVLDSFSKITTLECYAFMPILKLEMNKKIDKIIKELQELKNDPNMFIAKNPFIISKLTIYKNMIKPVSSMSNNLSKLKKPDPPINQDLFESKIADISKLLSYITAIHSIKNARKNLIDYRNGIINHLKWVNELLSNYTPFTQVAEENIKQVQKLLNMMGITMDILKYATIGVTIGTALLELGKCIQKQPKDPIEAANTVEVRRLAGPAEQINSVKLDNYYSSSAKNEEKVKNAQADAEKHLEKVKEFTKTQKKSGKLQEAEIEYIDEKQLEKPSPTLANEIYSKARIE